jgi:hypothetical protein
MQNEQEKVKRQDDQDHDHGKHGSDNGHGKDYVNILINERSYQVHQGRLEVAKIRELDDIPSMDVVYQLPEYLLLASDGFVVVHGGDMFKSGAPSGQSS